MIWHLYDYNLDAGGGYFAVKKACEPLHIQYSYDDGSVVVVNSTFAPVAGLHASIHLYNMAWKELYNSEVTLDAAADSARQAFSVPESLYQGSDRIFFIDLTLADSSGKVLSRNFYWVPAVLTSFDWPATDFTHTPALRHEDLAALTNLPPSKVTARAEIDNSPNGRELHLYLTNSSVELAFQISAALRTHSGGLIAPVLWSDNWIELTPGESRTLTALLPDSAPADPVVQIEGWNIATETINPTAAVATK